jgi:hypothetical protein
MKLLVNLLINLKKLQNKKISTIFIRKYNKYGY